MLLVICWSESSHLHLLRQKANCSSHIVTFMDVLFGVIHSAGGGFTKILTNSYLYVMVFHHDGCSGLLCCKSVVFEKKTKIEKIKEIIFKLININLLFNINLRLAGDRPMSPKFRKVHRPLLLPITDQFP